MTNTRFQQHPITINGITVAVVEAFPSRNRIAHDGTSSWKPEHGVVWRVFWSRVGETRCHALSANEYRTAEDASAAFRAAEAAEKPTKRSRRSSPKRSHVNQFRQARLRAERLNSALAAKTDGHDVSFGHREVSVKASNHQPALYRYPVLLNGSNIGHIEGVRHRERGPITRSGHVTIGDRLVTQWEAHPATSPSQVRMFRTRVNAADYLAGVMITAGSIHEPTPTF